MSFREEFPDFDVATMPEIPGSWVDTSWKNDSCPSFLYTNPKGDYAIFIDYEKTQDREFPESDRFIIVGQEGDVVTSTDDWSEVLAFFA